MKKLCVVVESGFLPSGRQRVCIIPERYRCPRELAEVLSLELLSSDGSRLLLPPDAQFSVAQAADGANSAADPLQFTRLTSDNLSLIKELSRIRIDHPRKLAEDQEQDASAEIGSPLSQKESKHVRQALNGVLLYHAKVVASLSSMLPLHANTTSLESGPTSECGVRVKALLGRLGSTEPMAAARVITRLAVQMGTAERFESQEAATTTLQSELKYYQQRLAFLQEELARQSAEMEALQARLCNSATTSEKRIDDVAKRNSVLERANDDLRAECAALRHANKELKRSAAPRLTMLEADHIGGSTDPSPTSSAAAVARNTRPLSSRHPNPHKRSSSNGGSDTALQSPTSQQQLSLRPGGKRLGWMRDSFRGPWNPKEAELEDVKEHDCTATAIVTVHYILLSGKELSRPVSYGDKQFLTFADFERVTQDSFLDVIAPSPPGENASNPEEPRGAVRREYTYLHPKTFEKITVKTNQCVQQLFACGVTELVAMEQQAEVERRESETLDLTLTLTQHRQDSPKGSSGTDPPSLKHKKDSPVYKRIASLTRHRSSTVANNNAAGTPSHAGTPLASAATKPRLLSAPIAVQPASQHYFAGPINTRIPTEKEIESLFQEIGGDAPTRLVKTRNVVAYLAKHFDSLGDEAYFVKLIERSKVPGRRRPATALQPANAPRAQLTATTAPTQVPADSITLEQFCIALLKLSGE